MDDIPVPLQPKTCRKCLLDLLRMDFREASNTCKKCTYKAARRLLPKTDKKLHWKYRTFQIIPK